MLSVSSDGNWPGRAMNPAVRCLACQFDRLLYGFEIELAYTCR